VNPFAFAPRANQSFVSQDAKLLGQRGLRDSKLGFQLADAGLALGEPTQQKQSIGIGEDFEQTTG
jgi:hypothetical protein